MYGDDLLQGKLVKLTETRKDDIPQLNQWFNSLEYQRYLRRGLVRPFMLEETQQWLEKPPDNDDLLFTIRLLENDQLIGQCSIKDVQWQARYCEVWIGIGDPTLRGKGYGTDGMRVMIRYAFMEMNLNRVGLVVGSFNERALASYKKVGFKQEGTMRQIVYRDGVYYDMHIMSILRSEWQEE